MKNWLRSLLPILTGITLAAGPAIAAEPGSPKVGLSLSAIDNIWSGHSVAFGLAVSKDRIFVGYYDSNRQLTIASRPRDAAWWSYHKMDSWTNWDSHNSIALAVDGAGQLHVAANMHNDPLVYFRTREAGDVRTLARVRVMVRTAAERRMTYPQFLQDGSGRLVFKYRDGGSGNGSEIYNLYDLASGTWRHLLYSPLVDGEGHRNAYFVGPVLGPDGWFHLTWVWRDTPDASTNHDLSYAKSRDLVRWFKSDGTALALPIRLESAEVVDPVPVASGMINNNTMIGFDPAGRPLISYHKFDSRGRTQIYVARRDVGSWTIRQASDWTEFRWDFSGRGSLNSRLTLSPPRPLGTDRISIALVRDGQPIEIVLDSRTLQRIEERPHETLFVQLAPLIAIEDGMQLNLVQDPNGSGFALAWPARPPQRDQPGEDIPAPTILRLVEQLR